MVRPPANDDSISIEEIKNSRLTNRKKPQKSSGMHRQDSPSCTRCGKSPPHTKDKCPAKDAGCKQCSKKGHFQKVCKSKINPPQQPTISQVEEEDAFLGVVHSNQSVDPWVVELHLNKQCIKFKIDTGADVTVIPASVYKECEHGSLKHSDHRLNGADQQPLQVKTELERMEKLGVIAKVQQPTDWCAGMVIVPKPNGTIRICVDLTKLNASVCRERHILPSAEETLAQLGDTKVFSKLDANSGFWQLKLASESALLTTFITPFGRYCFKRLPFGISSAPEVFQRRMSEILNGIEGVVCMMDDVLVFSKDKEEHNR